MKACFLPEWSTIKVTPELIQSREWARSRAWSDTGLRCGEIIAIDYDVNDPELLNGLLDAVIEAGILTESPYVRVGRPPREMWIYRTSDKIGKRTTGAFQVNDDTEEEKVEILGAGCQFAAYGQRDETTAYSWPVQSLLDAQYMDLPEITLAGVEALKDFAIAYFESKGLERKSPMAGTDGGYNHVYDLTPDMVFDVKDMGEMSVAEISAYLQTAPSEVLRCTVDALRPTSGSWAGMASLVQGTVCISDHGTYESHFPAELDDNTAVSKLGALLSERIFAAEAAAVAAPPAPAEQGDEAQYEDLDTRDKFDVNLARALKRFVFCKNGSQIFDLGERHRTVYTTKEMREQLTTFHTVSQGKRGGENVTWLFEAWTMHPDRRTVTNASMRPDRPYPIYVEHGTTYLNTYQPPVHVGHGSADIGIDMIDGLLAIPAERHYFKQWLRHKIENPHVPGPGIIMVAQDTFGTGRGNMFKLLNEVFGDQYVSNINFNTLVGKNSQSQYNEWLVDSLLVTVNEAHETGAQNRWQARADAYEHIKEVVDPDMRKVSVLRKGVKNGQGISYASFIIASNHGDTLVIPADDRRLAVLENGTPRPFEFWTLFRQWMAEPGNVAAFVRAILATDMTGFNAFTAPPVTRAKADMIDAGTSDLDRAIKSVLQAMPGALIVKEQVLMHLEDYVTTNAVEFPENWERVAVSAWQRATKKMLGEDRITIEGKQRTVRSIGAVTPEMLSSSDALRAELDKNGPISRTVKSGGSVVNFPVRR